MTTRPRVSVITPVFNGARTLDETIRSVLAQTERSWEQIIVDDGSTDGTAPVVHGVHDPRVRYVSRPHEGRSAARNHALQLATGDVLLFLDADDWLLPNALSAHLDNLARHPDCGVSVSDGHFCTDSGQPIVRFSERRAATTNGLVLSRIVLDAALVGAPVTAMIRREVVTTHALRFDPAQAIGEDWLFWIDSAQHTLFAFTPALTCGYRWHESNTTLGADRAFRREELWRLRQQVMARHFFAGLPLSTRSAFFYQVLVDLLPGCPQEQEDLLDDQVFRQLPGSVQAQLIQLAASESLLAGDAPTHARTWLWRARQLAPPTPKLRLLDALVTISPGLARTGLRLWRRSGRAESPLAPSIGITPRGMASARGKAGC